MQLKSPDSPDDLRLLAGWLAEKENHQWLDFGDGRQVVSLEWLKMAMQRGTCAIRLFTADHDDRPIGVTALTNINIHFRTANYWVILGDKAYARRGYASRATEAMLTIGFSELGLRAIHTWCVDENPSVGVAERVGFRPMGRQRQCHYIDGRPHDRLWFDLLASEHKRRSPMADASTLREQVADVFLRSLNLDVPSPDTDLFETGLLDSLAFVELLVGIEREFSVTTSVEDLEVDNFRSIARIAEFVAARMASV